MSSHQTITEILRVCAFVHYTVYEIVPPDEREIQKICPKERKDPNSDIESYLTFLKWLS